jgi:Hemolysins and related proteins containing CBS domains
MAALDVLEALRKAPAHLVLVYDEFGHFEGIVTPMDVLEAIAGEFPDAAGAEAKFEVREDGSLLVAGWTPVDEFAERTGIALAPDRDYATVAGLVLALRGTLPRAGESVEVGGWRLEVVDLDGRRIDKVLAEPLETGPRPSG